MFFLIKFIVISKKKIRFSTNQQVLFLTNQMSCLRLTFTLQDGGHRNIQLPVNGKRRKKAPHAVTNQSSLTGIPLSESLKRALSVDTNKTVQICSVYVQSQRKQEKPVDRINYNG